MSSAPGETVGEARRQTDSNLLAERHDVDKALEGHLEETQRWTDERLETGRERIDEEVAAATQQARREAASGALAPSKVREAVEQAGDREGAQGAPGERVEAAAAASRWVEAQQKKSVAAVEQVAETTSEALERERRHVDELTAEERQRRKIAFLSVLAFERRNTDQALEIERHRSDLIVQNRDELLGEISHDLRNYLQVVALKAGMLKSVAARDPEALDALVGSIVTACTTMGRWATDLMDLSKLDTGELALERRPHDAAELIRESVRAFAAAASEKDIALSAELPERSPAILCDGDRITQVLHNLLDNAIKFVSAAGEVRVRLREGPDGFVTISVKDNGPGVSAENRDRLFERGWRGEPKAARGSGLGLYISQRIVTAHGGKIWLESQEGQGSTFSFTVPTARARR